MKILSLFDGMSVAQQALKNIGANVEVYYASEIDEYAITVTQSNFPNTIQIGNVEEVKNHWDFIGMRPDIDLMIGGSPCQDLSIANKGREGLKGSRSSLFWEYVRIRDEVKPKYFILENVASMPKEAKDTISEALGVEPVMINASLVSAQNRKRLFWVGKLVGDTYQKAEIPQPEDRGILLKDILEDEVDEKYFIKDYKTKWNSDKPIDIDKDKYKVLRVGGDTPTIRLGQIGAGGQGDRIYSPEGKSTSLSANGGGRGAKTGLYAVALTEQRTEEAKAIRRENMKSGKDYSPRRAKELVPRKDKKANTITTGQTKESLIAIYSNYNNTLNYDKANTLGSNSQCQTAKTGQGLIDFKKQIIRKLTPTECLRLQSMPDDYFDKAEYKGKPISNTQRYKMCGNAFNCKVIEHILTFIKA